MTRVIVAALLAALALPGIVHAQIAMPDPRQMSGIPRPVTDLPDRTVSVRLIRGDLSNNIPNHPIELLVDGQSQTVRTGEDGRAQFGPFSAGATLKAVAVVDGERLESETFPAPSQGGVRLMLVATDKNKPSAPVASAVPGEVTIGGETRFVIEWGDENVRVFYMLDIENGAATPVNPAQPFIFDLPTGAIGAGFMQGSSPQATLTGTRVLVAPPFAPGTTHIELGFILPAPNGAVTVDQRFPVTLGQVNVLIEKAGDATLSSPNIERQQEMPLAGRTYIAAAGREVPAGSTMSLSVNGLPHHSPIPRWTALALVVLIGLVGIWAGRKPAGPRDVSDRKQLLRRREKLLEELVRLERDQRRGRLEEAKYATRREQLMLALEEIYDALDTGDGSPEPAGRAGMAA